MGGFDSKDAMGGFDSKAPLGAADHLIDAELLRTSAGGVNPQGGVKRKMCDRVPLC